MADIKELYEELRTVYSSMHSIFQANRNLYNLKINTAAPKNFPCIVPATAKRIIRQGVNQLITDTPVITVECGDTKAEQEIAGTLTEICYLLLQQWDIQNGTPPAQEIAFNLCLHGMGVKNNIYNPDYDGLEALQISVPSPINYFPDPAGKYDLIVYNLYVGEIKEMIRKWKEKYPNGGFYDIPFTLRDTDNCTWIEYISASKKGWYTIEGNNGYPVSELKDNILGLKPTYYRYSGWGITSPDGLPEEKAIGLYDGIQSSLEAQARGWTAVDNHLRLNVYGRYLFDVDSGITQEQVNQAMIPGGATLIKNPQSAIVPIPEVNINRDEWSYLTILDDDIESMTYNRAVMGGGAADESGLKSMTRIRQASLNFRPVRRSLEIIMGEALRTAILIMKNDLVMGKAFKYSGKSSIDPSKIPEHFSIKVQYEAVDPQEDTERIRIGLDLLNQKAISIRTFLNDYLRSPNPDDEISQMLAEGAVFQEPNTRMALGAKILESMGWTEAITAMKESSVNIRPEARRPAPPGSEQRLNNAPVVNPVRTHVGTEYV